MSLTIGTGTLLLNLDNVQQKFQNTVTQLSSGLRVNSAADDPSGNAIATNLQSKSLGLQQAAQNVQNANNALNVAMGALSSVQTILERINTLTVEANSDINSSADLQDIQSEINSLLTEINTIGEKTSFNGLQLLNGQFDESSGTNPTFQQVTSPYGGSTDVENETGAPGGQSGPLITFQGSPIPLIDGDFVPALMVFTVTGYSSNAYDPDSNSFVGPGVYVQFDAYSTAGGISSSGAPLFQDITAVPLASPSGTGQLGPASYATPTGGTLVQNWTLANITAADVGTSIAFLSTNGTGASTGSALSLNDGGDEGDTIGISLPTVNTNVLGLSSISVLDPAVVNFFDQDQGAASSNLMAASSAEIAVQSALTQITTAQAQIGAQVVSLNIDDQNDNTAVNEYTESASNITDLNIGQATTQYTQEQILVNVGTSVLAQVNTDNRQNTALLIQALVA